MSGPEAPEHLVVVDLQRAFGDPASSWAAPAFSRAAAGIERLLPAYAGRTALTRFVAPETPEGAWRPYYERWPEARRPADDPLWDLVPPVAGLDAPVVTATTFGKWGAALETATAGSRRLLLAGVSTDCCVLSTALAAADAGCAVRVAADACAGASDEDHERALAAMALYAPLVEVVRVDDVLAAAAA